MVTFYWFTNSFEKNIIMALWQGDSKAVWRKGNYYFAEMNGLWQWINDYLTQTAWFANCDG